MSKSSTSFAPSSPCSQLESVEGELSYIVDDGKQSVRYVDWPEEAHKTHIPPYERRRVTIHNARLQTEAFALEQQGFVLREQPSAMSNFFDEAEIKQVYYPETAETIRRECGASRVVVFDHTVRTSDPRHHQPGWIRNTVKSVHNDYTERSAPQRLRNFFPDEAESLLANRFAIIQTWRSIASRVECDPLALCDGRTIPKVGFISNQRRYRDRIAETYHISYNPQHKWYFFPYMTSDEVLIFKVFDSAMDVGTRFTAHSAFEDPSSPKKPIPRESIEMRAFALF